MQGNIVHQPANSTGHEIVLTHFDEQKQAFFRRELVRYLLTYFIPQ